MSSGLSVSSLKEDRRSVLSVLGEKEKGLRRESPVEIFSAPQPCLHPEEGKEEEEEADRDGEEGEEEEVSLAEASADKEEGAREREAASEDEERNHPGNDISARPASFSSSPHSASCGSHSLLTSSSSSSSSSSCAGVVSAPAGEPLTNGEDVEIELAEEEKKNKKKEKEEEEEEEEGEERRTEAGSLLVPGSMAPSIPRLRGKQAWRGKGERRSFGRFCNELANKHRGKWEDKRRLKELLKSLREEERERRERRSEMLRKKREKTEARRRRKEENELKSCPVQVIKNTSKIRSWGKKARKSLVKMSAEMIQKLYGVSVEN